MAVPTRRLGQLSVPLGLRQRGFSQLVVTLRRVGEGFGGTECLAWVLNIRYRIPTLDEHAVVAFFVYKNGSTHVQFLGEVGLPDFSVWRSHFFGKGCAVRAACADGIPSVLAEAQDALNDWKSCG